MSSSARASSCWSGRRPQGDVRQVVSVAIYGATLVLLYTVSILYHSFRGGGIRRRLRLADHTAIILFIAGTYTPFVLVTLSGALGWSLFGVVWGSRWRGW